MSHNVRSTTSRKHWLVGLAAVCLLLLLVEPQVLEADSLTPIPKANRSAQASPLEEACYNLDVIFIVDQSDSMSGFGAAPEHDPNEERIYAPYWTIDWLVENVLGRCPQALHRIAVVSFGTDARVDLELTNIRPLDRDEGLALRERLRSKIQPQALGATDPLDGFREAVNIWENASPAGNEPRKRLVIFLTDGEPCVPELGCYTLPDGTTVNNMDTRQYLGELQTFINEHLPFDPLLLQQEQCLQELRDIYAEEPPAEEVSRCYERYRFDNTAAFADALARSTYIWVLLLKQDQPWTSWIRQYYVDIAESHAGKVVDLTTNRSDIPGSVASILTRAAGVKVSLLQCGAFAVNPYLRAATLSFFKLSEDVIVTLSYTDVNGTEHTIQKGLLDGQPDPSIEYRAEGAHEVYVIHHPYPGIWNLQSDACEGSQFYYEPTEINAAGPELSPRAVPQYDLGDCYDPGDPRYIEYQMRDTGAGGGEVIPQAEDPQFAPRITTIVTDPLGNEKAYEMRWDPATQKYRSTEPVQVCTAGTYTIDITGEVGYASPPYSVVGSEWPFNQTHVLFDHQDIPLEVLEVIPFEFHIVEPTEGATISPIHKLAFSRWPPLKVNPLSIRVRVTGRDSTELPGSPDDLWAEEGTPFIAEVWAGERSETVELHPDARRPWEYVGEAQEIDTEGPYEVSVQIAGVPSEDYRPDMRERQVTFSRADILFTRSGFYWVITVIVCLILSAFVARGVWARQNRLRGSLIFESGTDRVATISINSPKRWKTIKKELAFYPELHLQYLKVEHVSLPKEQMPDDLLGATEATVPPRAIRVRGKTTSGSPVNIPELRLGEPTLYSADVSFTMRYALPGEEEY